VQARDVKDELACPVRCSIDGWINTENQPPERRVALNSDAWLEALFSGDGGVRVALIDFFAYSCTNCVRTIHGMQQLHERYGKDGLLVIALHRPEFDFEKEVVNLRHFVDTSNIGYLVGMDNHDSAWEAWDVSMWPTHFLVHKNKGAVRKVAIRGGDAALWVGDSQRNHVEIEAAVKALLAGDRIKALPEDGAAEVHWLDMEIFLGRLHVCKNVGRGGSSCSDGACIVERPASVDKGQLGEASRPATRGFTVYGAAWCRFCRSAKLLLDGMKTKYDYVDVEALGGPAAVIAALGAAQSSIPLVYHDEALLGGFDGLSAFVAPKEGARLEEVEAHAQRVRRSLDEARQTVVTFDKVHSATVALQQGWGMQNERVGQRTRPHLRLSAERALPSCPPFALQSPLRALSAPRPTATPLLVRMSQSPGRMAQWWRRR